MRALVLNCGSSSLKHAVITREGDDVDRSGGTIACEGPQALAGAVANVLNALDDAPDVVGHRITHGGPEHAGPVRVNLRIVDELGRLTSLAPLHMPPQLEALAMATDALPGVPQVACFDTAFHRSMPEAAQRLPLPRRLWDRGIRRYGFHGLVCESVVAALGSDCPRRLVIAHLGSGASVTAVLDGQSVDTTMGMTPEGGLIMATRPGDLDPGVLLYLEREGEEDLDDMLARRSGLLGISARTGDMRELLASAASDPDAAMAVEMFCRSSRRAIAGMAAMLGGIDMLVFSGGIGEHSPEVREAICGHLGFLGIDLDAAVAGVPVQVVTADEELVIARHAMALADAPGDPAVVQPSSSARQFNEGHG